MFPPYDGLNFLIMAAVDTADRANAREVTAYSSYATVGLANDAGVTGSAYRRNLPGEVFALADPRCPRSFFRAAAIPRVARARVGAAVEASSPFFEALYLGLLAVLLHAAVTNMQEDDFFISESVEYPIRAEHKSALRCLVAVFSHADQRRFGQRQGNVSETSFELIGRRHAKPIFAVARDGKNS